jgi:hypothetical protein
MIIIKIFSRSHLENLIHVTAHISFKGPTRIDPGRALCYPFDPVSIPLNQKLSPNILFALVFPTPSVFESREREHDIPGNGCCCFSYVDKYWLSTGWGGV